MPISFGSRIRDFIKTEAVLVIAAVSAFNMDMQACCAAVALARLIIDRRVFIDLDVSLLATSICFFVFLGNLKQIDSVSSFISGILTGREVLASLSPAKS